MEQSLSIKSKEDNKHLKKDVNSSAYLVNSRKTAASLEPRGLQRIVNFSVKALNDGQELRSLDAWLFSENDGKDSFVESFYLQSIVKKIESKVDLVTPRKKKACRPIKKSSKSISPATCCSKVMPSKLAKKAFGDDAPVGAVDIIQCGENVSYHGLMLCKNVWGCPVCTKRISERRKNGLELLLKAHFDRYGSNTVMFETYTVSHGAGDDIVCIVKRMSKAYKSMVESRAYKVLMKGVRGTSRATEVTYGFANGFHPHFHVLHFFDHDISFEIDTIRIKLYMLWFKALEKQGFPPIVFDFFIVKLVGSSAESLGEISKYMSKPEKEKTEKEKITWGIQHELTKWHSKKGKNTRRFSMFDFLREYAAADVLGHDDDRKTFYNLWLVYRRAFKGKRQLFTQHKDFKIVDLELSDEELSDSITDEKKKCIASLSFDEWILIMFMRAKASLLKVAKSTNGEGVPEFIKGLIEMYDSLPFDKQTVSLLNFYVKENK